MSTLDRDPSYLPPEAASAVTEGLEWASANYRLVWTAVVSLLLLAVYWRSILRALSGKKAAPSLSKDKEKFEQLREARFRQQEETQRALREAAEEQKRREAEKKARDPVTEKPNVKKAPPGGPSIPPAGGRTFNPLTGAGTRRFRPSGFQRPRRGG